MLNLFNLLIASGRSGCHVSRYKTLCRKLKLMNVVFIKIIKPFYLNLKVNNPIVWRNDAAALKTFKAQGKNLSTAI